MPGFIIRKRDGSPSFQIVSLANDLEYGVDYIVRGQDLLPSAAAQLYTAEIAEKMNF